MKKILNTVNVMTRHSIEEEQSCLYTHRVGQHNGFLLQSLARAVLSANSLISFRRIFFIRALRNGVQKDNISSQLLVRRNTGLDKALGLSGYRKRRTERRPGFIDY